MDGGPETSLNGTDISQYHHRSKWYLMELYQSLQTLLWKRRTLTQIMRIPGTVGLLGQSKYPICRSCPNQFDIIDIQNR